MATLVLKANTPDDGNFVQEAKNATEMLDCIIDHVEPSFLFNMEVFVKKDGEETLYAKGYYEICQELHVNEKQLNETMLA